MRAVVLVAILGWFGVVSADPKTEQAAAHYRQGVAFEKAAAYDQAIDEYKQAYALDLKASHLFNIGRVYDLESDPRSAILFYEKYLAADPASPKAKEVRELIAVATKKVADEDAAKKKADEEKAAQELKLAVEKERIRVLSEAHLKQAAELARAGTWASAAAEYVKATDVDGNPAHLIDAAEAYRKQPDLAKAKATFEQYLDKVPNGERSDEIRAKVADLAREIETARIAKEKADADRKAKADKAAADERARLAAIQAARGGNGDGPHARGRSRGYKLGIAGLVFGGASAVFMVLGNLGNDAIEHGRVGSGAEISNKIRTGRTYNYLAWGTGILGGAGILVGGISIGMNLGSDEPSMPSSIALTLRGQL